MKPASEFISPLEMPPQDVLALARNARRVTVLSGAGISAESGVPTFRGPREALWAEFDPRELDSVGVFERDPALVWGWYLWRASQVRCAQPNAGHRALAAWGLRGVAMTVVTQNIDDLHERGGSTGVIHLHGSLFAPRCATCGQPYPMNEVLLAMDAGPHKRVQPPHCPACNGLIRPGVVWFGENLPEEPLEKAANAMSTCDLALVIGTSSVVYPAAALPLEALRHDIPVVEINPERTPLSDHRGVLHWAETAARALPALLASMAEKK